jgi:hypothetical protein
MNRRRLLVLSAFALAGLGAVLLWTAWPKPRHAHDARPVAASAAPPRMTNVADSTPAGRGPAATAKAKIASASGSPHIREMARLQECLSSTACDFPQTDPRSYEIAVGQAMRLELLKARQDGTAAGDLEFLGRTYIHSYDGFVQEEALKILSGLPPSAESLQALTEGLKDTPDADLMEQALPELKRYIGTPWEPGMHDFLAGQIARGAHFAATTAVENLLPFLNQKSVSTYSRALAQMPPGTKAARELGRALREYRRLRTGA